MVIRILSLVLVALLPFSALAQDRAVPESTAQMQLSFAPVVRQVSPAVVNIYTKRVVTRAVQSPFMNDPFFSRFFNNNALGGRMRKQIESSLGSGVIVEPDGLIVTNAHVAGGAEEVTVVLYDGREMPADIVLVDERSDIAVLRAETEDKNLPFANFKPSESLQVGDIVLAIGNPFGVGQTVTSGIVSAQGRSSLNINDFNFFIQTDAAINPGNSGGPLVALDGGVVGINTAIYSRDGGSLGIGFAVPSEMVLSVLTAAKEGRSGAGIVRPWLGVSVQTVTGDIADSLGLERPQGALISDLHKASPLRKAGIQQGDVAITLNGKAIRDPGEMKFRMATVPLGQKAEIEVLRSGARKAYQVEAMAPPEDPPRAETSLRGAHPLNGAVIVNLNPAVATELGISDQDSGVVVLRIEDGTRGIRAAGSGDIILEINGAAIANVADVQKVLAAGSANGWSLVIERQGQKRRVVIR